MYISKGLNKAIPSIGLAALLAVSCAPNVQPEQAECSPGKESSACHPAETEPAPAAAIESPEPAITEETVVAEPVPEIEPEPVKDYANARDLQEALTRHCEGLSDAFIDGKAGPNTIKMLIKFQKAYDLVPDGIIGVQTTKALNSDVNGKCSA